MQALGEGSGSAAQTLEVVTQVGIEALYRVGLLLSFGYYMAAPLRPLQVRVDR